MDSIKNSYKSLHFLGVCSYSGNMNKELIMEEMKRFPISRLFFEKDMRFGGQGWVYEEDPNYDYTFGGYTWRIEDSNANIDKFGFSFYLAYFAFNGHTLCVPPKGKRYDFSINPAYKVSGYLFEKPELGLVEVVLSGKDEEGLIITQASEIFDKDVALYIDKQIELYGLKRSIKRRIRKFL